MHKTRIPSWLHQTHPRNLWKCFSVACSKLSVSGDNHWKTWAGDEWDQQRLRYRRERERAREAVSDILKTSICPLVKRNRFMSKSQYGRYCVICTSFRRSHWSSQHNIILCFCMWSSILCLEFLRAWKSLCRLCRHTENLIQLNLDYPDLLGPR